MDFKQLESFIAIVKYKSFSAAAEHLYITQPTISNHIIALERELNTILLNRVNKNVTLTDQGLLFYKHAINILNSRDIALFELKNYEGDIDSKLEIASSTVPQNYFLVNFVKEFSESFPSVKYKILMNDTKEVYDLLYRGDIDFGLMGNKIPSHTIEYIRVLGDDIVLIAPPDAPIDSITVEDIKDLPLIIREEGSGTRAIFLEALNRMDIHEKDLHIIAEIESTETIKKFVRGSLGYAFISNKEILDELECNKLKVVPVKDLTLSRSFYFAYNKKITLSPLAEEFMKMIVRHQM